jgi:hypothetical protein
MALLGLLASERKQTTGSSTHTSGLSARKRIYGYRLSEGEVVYRREQAG